MGSLTVPKKTPSSDKATELLQQVAKTQFITATMNLGWRLALTVVIPLVGGVKLDEKLGSSPSWTLTGMFIAVAAGCGVVWQTIKEVTEQQAEAANAKDQTNKESK
jgi:F0F1-type ATP synthase assembly protein I